VARRVIQSVSGVQTSYSGNGLTTTCVFPWYNNITVDTQLRIGAP